MRRRAITAFVLAAALAFVPVSGELVMTVNAAENTGKTQLSVPTGVQWGEKGIATWNAVENAEGYYHVELYRDGKSVKGISGLCVLNGETAVSEDLRRFFDESGAYQFRVRSYASYDSDNYTNSEWSELSNVYNYVRPDKILGNTIPYWSDKEPGTICWQPVEGAGGYNVMLYQYGDSGNYIVSSRGGYSTDFTSEDFSDNIESRGAGKYYCTVTALSADIEAIANGTEGAPSEYYDTNATTDVISGIISDAVKDNATSAQALETIKSEINKASLRTAMQTSDTVLNQIKNLESAYAAEQGVKVNAPVVSEEASTYVKADEISVIGAGLNAAAGEGVELEISVPAEKKYVPDQHYANSVQLEIQLKKEGTPIHELDIPVTITLPVPKGLDAKRLVILHYREDGSFETVNSRNNGDGTVTFSVSRFSTFAFAERNVDSSTTFDSNDEDALNANDEITDRIMNAAEGEVIRVKGVAALSNGNMQALLKRSDVALVLEYIYEGENYVVTIPAGSAVNDDIPWYGPLYLAGRYGNGVTGAVGTAGAAYTVRFGDTMTGIARAYGMTLSQLVAKNPQVKNIDYIVVGQKINVR